MNTDPPIPPERETEDLDTIDKYWNMLQEGGQEASNVWLRESGICAQDLLDDLQVLRVLFETRTSLLEATQVTLQQDPIDRARDVLAPGTLVDGKYTIVGLQGQGGMGEVYLTWHEVMNCYRAVKVLPAQFAESPEFVERFHREIKLQASVSHPNIVAATDAGEIGGRPYLVMEYVEGLDLKKYVEKHGPLPAGQACDVVRQAALGLAHAHGQGLVHRDVKPSNLLRTPDGTIKVLDLGLARLLDQRAANGNVSRTTPGQTLGTLTYMAPEQLENPKKADGRSDLYSLGCTLHFLLTGLPPALARASAGEEFDLTVPKIPRQVGKLLRKLLASDPQDRYQTAEALVSAIDAVRPPCYARGTWRISLFLMATVILTLSFIKPSLIGCHSRQPTHISLPSANHNAERDRPVLERFDLYILRSTRNQPEAHSLVSGGEERSVSSPEPLAPDDSFRLEGQFRFATYWYLLWFDTAGRVAIVAQPKDGEEARTSVVYPADQGGEPQSVTVDPNDPPGVHVVLLAAGSFPPTPQNVENLKTGLESVGPPPSVLPPTHGRLLRGPGKPAPVTTAELPSGYEQKLRTHLPAGLLPIYSWYFQTRR